MEKKRIIPLLLLKDGLLVRSQKFTTHQIIGNPMSTISRYMDWGVDEVIILDISETKNNNDLRRNDLYQNYKSKNIFKLLREISKFCFFPLTFGGGIKNIQQIEKLLLNGADKISINSQVFFNKNLINDAAKRFGSQSIVVSVDVKRINEKYFVFISNGFINTHCELNEWLRIIQDNGAGEILINSIDRDGTALGFDKKIFSEIPDSINVPIIFCGGAGKPEDFFEVLQNEKISAACAANIFHFKELSYPNIKLFCVERGANIRSTDIKQKFFSREPKYKKNEGIKLINKRLNKINELKKSFENYKIKWCKKCVYPSISAAPLEFNEYGVCTGCQISEQKKKITKIQWKKRERILKNIFKNKSNNTYDCVVAVSGGKDSYYQTHYVKNVLKLNPLLVTYDGNNWTEVGWRNMKKMKDVFKCDHIIVRPSTDILIKLNKLGFVVMGDMNWHAHVGIMTVPMAIAVKYKVPFVFYGEHGYLDISGQFSLDDFPEVTYRDRLEHFARGFEWNFFVGLDSITEKDMITWKYPSDKEIFDLNLRGIFLGNYVYWEANEHIKLVKEKYKFEISKEPFDRTYRTMSNLDDMHENGVHDYLKYIKFGYGRATDHACKDIRAKKLTRIEAIKLVKKYDHVKPKDLKRWLEYTNTKEKDFDRIADTFRDPRVWKKKNKKWKKRDIL